MRLAAELYLFAFLKGRNGNLSADIGIRSMQQGYARVRYYWLLL
jgi:hypothetical protein